MSVIAHNLQMDNICRTCLSEEENMKSIFDRDSNSKRKSLQFFQMLMAFTSVQVAEDDGLPTQICLSCVENIIRSFTFKTLCDDSDYTLRRILRNATISSDDEPLSKLKPSTNVALSSQEAHADNNEMLNIKMEFEEVLVNEYMDGEKDDSNLMITANDLEPLIDEFTNTEDMKPDIVDDQIDFETNTLLIEDKKSICLMSDNNEQPTDTCNDDSNIHSDTDQKSSGRHKYNMRNKESASAKSLRSQARAHTKFICSECGKGFPNRTSMHYHKKMHADMQSLTCTVCDKTFYYRIWLIRHMKTHPELNDNICTYCDEGFRTASDLKEHEQTHTDRKPYICNVCNLTFAHRSHLDTHARTHSGDNPYVCDVCDRVCCNPSKLREHMRIHTGEKPFRCHLCSRTFQRSEKLRVHIKQHTGDRNHKCAYCKKGFYQASTLKMHLRIHTGEKPYTCKNCNRSFLQRGTLVAHLRTHRRRTATSTFQG